MTDRLKEWLDAQDGDDLNGSAGHKVLEALRAVVELHGPSVNLKDGKPYDYCPECGYTWPCQTIRAIEKEITK